MRHAGLLSVVPLTSQGTQEEDRWVTLPGRVSDLGPPLAVPFLHLQLLGSFRLTCGEIPVTGIETPRLQALLSYLALHHGVPQSRTKLAALFWPDSTEGQAHTNLLYKMRQALPSANRWLVMDQHRLWWRDEGSWRLVVLEFVRAMTRAEQAEREGDTSALQVALEQAIALYQGDLLPTCYDEWVLPERDRLRQAYLGALEQLAALLEDEGNTVGAIRAAQRLLREDPLHEAGYRHLMYLYAASGNQTAVVRTYRSCSTTLERELAVEPSFLTRRVYEQLVEAEHVLRLAECSKSRRTLALDWRGHGLSANSQGDFGADDLVQDALAVIEASGAQHVVPVATAHAGWVAIELRRRLAERIPKINLLEWIVFEASPPFLTALQALQDPEQWEKARAQLFSMWFTGVDNSDVIRLVHEMATQGFEMWARAGREISAAYHQQGAPLQMLSRLEVPVPVRHLYAQEPPGYLAAQQAFATEHPWFSVRRVAARSHFPTTEVPDVVATEIERFVAS